MCKLIRCALKLCVEELSASKHDVVLDYKAARFIVIAL